MIKQNSAKLDYTMWPSSYWAFQIFSAGSRLWYSTLKYRSWRDRVWEIDSEVLISEETVVFCNRAESREICSWGLADKAVRCGHFFKFLFCLMFYSTWWLILLSETAHKLTGHNPLLHIEFSNLSETAPAQPTMPTDMERDSTRQCTLPSAQAKLPLLLSWVERLAFAQHFVYWGSTQLKTKMAHRKDDLTRKAAPRLLTTNDPWTPCLCSYT